MKIIISFIFSLLFTIPAFSYSKENRERLIFSTPKIDSLLLRSHVDTLLVRQSMGKWEPFREDISYRDTIFFDPAFLPLVFDGQILPDNMNFYRPEEPVINSSRLIDPNETFLPQLQRGAHMRQLRKRLYMYNPTLVEFNAFGKEATRLEESGEVSKKNIFQELITVEKPSVIDAPAELERYQPQIIYWIKNGEHSVQIAQNYISQNWHKGGNSSFYVRNEHRLKLNYAKNKISFTNLLEWKLNVQQVPADTIRRFNMNEDLIRLENIFGITAYKNWSWTIRHESKSQIFNSYKINARALISGFISPLNVSLGLGMKYNLDWTSKNNTNRKIKFIPNIAPLSFNYVYVRKYDEIDVKRFGIEAGEKQKLKWGSEINAQLDYNVNQFISISSRFKYWTDYHQVVAESENKFNMILNRYFSTTAYLYLRFDDNPNLMSKKHEDWGYFQRNELLSFGLNYKW